MLIPCDAFDPQVRLFALVTGFDLLTTSLLNPLQPGRRDSFDAVQYILGWTLDYFGLFYLKPSTAKPLAKKPLAMDLGNPWLLWLELRTRGSWPSLLLRILPTVLLFAMFLDIGSIATNI